MQKLTDICSSEAFKTSTIKHRTGIQQAHNRTKQADQASPDPQHALEDADHALAAGGGWRGAGADHLSQHALDFARTDAPAARLPQRGLIGPADLQHGCHHGRHFFIVLVRDRLNAALMAEPVDGRSESETQG